MKYSILSLLVAVILFPGCKEDKGSLALNILGTYDGAPLVLGEDLSYTSDYDITLLTSSFYISDIVLKKGSEVISIKDVDFVDFAETNFTLENAMTGISLDYSEIEAGTYDGIEFSIGVAPSQNSMKPADFTSDNPLSKPGNHWEAWESYIFSKYGGKIGDDGFFFHTGTDPLYRTLEISKDIVISGDNTTTVKISLDHKKLMAEDGGLFDIENNMVNHDPLTVGPLEMLVNNYSTAFSFE